MASHLPFTLCTSSAPSPGDGLQISLRNHSWNLQHILVPNVSYSRILKAITQTPKDPRVIFAQSPKVMLLQGHHGTAKSHQDPAAVTVWLYHSLFTMKSQGLITLFQANVPYFLLFSKLCAQMKLNLLKLLPVIEMQISIGFLLDFPIYNSTFSLSKGSSEGGKELPCVN